MKPNIVAIIQARMRSSRLPNKVLLDIAGEPMLAHVVARASLAKTIDSVVVATTTDPSDDRVEMLCKQRGYAYYRGSEFDVLDRYYQAARLAGADAIVRVTADCPLIDPDLIDLTVNTFLGLESEFLQETRSLRPPPPDSFAAYDFTATRLPPPWKRTFPIGQDIEVCSFTGLELAWREASSQHQREHVMPFFYDQPERFRIKVLDNNIDYGALRWTVDTPEDLELIREIFARFPGRRDFTWLDVLALFENEPGLAQINTQIRHKDYRETDTRHGAGA
jgi:spore coat polysaccharide biosynthesis protein SpsF